MHWVLIEPNIHLSAVAIFLFAIPKNVASISYNDCYTSSQVKLILIYVLHILKNKSNLLFRRRFAFQWYVQIQCNRKEVCHTQTHSDIIVMVKIIGILWDGYLPYSFIEKLTFCFSIQIVCSVRWIHRVMNQRNE